MNKVNFQLLYNKFKSRKITKHHYIKKAFQIHKILFSYKKFLKNSDVKKIIINEKNILLEIKNNFLKNQRNIKLIVDQNDNRCIPIETFNFKKFEPNERDFLFYFAKKSKNIIDIGTNVGWYSLNFSLIKNVKLIHSFEPVPRTFNIFKNHIKLNKAKKIKANNLGLSDKSGVKKFFLSKESGSASLENIQNKKKIKLIKCKLSTLDNYIAKNKFKCDLIKIDVEGSELSVLKGSTKILKNNKPIIFTEMLRKWSRVFGYHPNDIINFLKYYGYSCYIVKKKNLKKINKITNKTKQTNFFFLHNHKHKKLIPN